MSRTTSGGSCRSASITTMASPSAFARPALTAAWWPKLRESSTVLTRGSSLVKFAARLGVASVLPSSTNTTCRSKSLLPSTATSLWYVAEITSSSLKHGTTTDNENRSGRAWQPVRPSRVLAESVFIGGWVTDRRSVIIAISLPFNHYVG